MVSEFTLMRSYFLTSVKLGIINILRDALKGEGRFTFALRLIQEVQEKGYEG